MGMIGNQLVVGMATAASVSDQNNTSSGAFDVPAGNTSQRPSTPSTGMIRYNSDTGYMESYTAAGWAAIATPPSITSVTPVTYNGEQGTQFTINGSFFDPSATVKFITSGGAEYSAASVTYVNSSQLLATTPQDFTVANEPLSVKVVNASGLSYVISSVIDCGGSPAWNTASGNIASVYDLASSATIATLSATDPDAGATVAYSITSGALPGGFTLNASTGAITGAPSSTVSSSTTYNFTAAATDNAGNVTTRAFSIVINPSVESGGGGGYVTALSDATVADQVTNTSMLLYYLNAQAASPNNPGDVLNFTNYGANSAYFKIHTGHDGVKPTYIVFRVSTGTPRVLNRLRWIKHANACGNIDIYGSNKDITTNPYTTMSNWTYLGRGFMGGYGSEGDGTVKTATFNSSNYGFKWYMVLVRDNSSSALSYPSEGSMSGYAMYGLTMDKT